jgi:hypothetical protein
MDAMYQNEWKFIGLIDVENIKYFKMQAKIFKIFNINIYFNK